MLWNVLLYCSKLLSILHPDTPYEADIFPVVNAISGPTVDDSEMTLKDNVSIQVKLCARAMCLTYQ